MSDDQGPETPHTIASPSAEANPAKDEFTNEFTTLPFIIDEKDQLAFRPPATRNHLGSVTRDTITEVEISKTYLSARVAQVSYGTYKSRSAAIIVVDFVFHSSDHRRQRFKDAEIEIDFTQEGGFGRAGDANSTAVIPISVAQFAPKLIYGEKKAEDVTWGLDLSVGANLVAGPASLEIANSAVYRESKYSRDHKLIIEGSARGSGSTRLVWSIQERKHDGIPPQFTTAFMVFHPRNLKFSAKMRVKASIGFSLDPRRWKIFLPNDDRMYFHNDHPKGPVMEETDFDKLDFRAFYRASLDRVVLEQGSLSIL
ncbi:hypothetical protein TWF730_009054 [Orbilia blumenaviensis]|uniref:Uncharacterized protein n=1 Tax=Orbilia blumenaviensis TaxID=1796055 RepID=A0AAV9V0G5_9PEZI